ncbi:MAG: tRNA pseudouridine(38-40) synthase TruA [Acidobacteriota bacterium]
MARVRLILSYDGRAYAGWQRQTNAVAVQQVLEEALGRVFEQTVTVTGAGRTDAGVHARGQVVHFDPPDRPNGAPLPHKALVHATNHLLPTDIRVLAAGEVADTFHARKSAIGKRYVYRLVEGRVVSPLDAPFASTLRRPLDLGAVRQALAALPGLHDFSAFALAGGAHTDPVRRLYAATVDHHPATDGRSAMVVFRFWGAGFLRGMVRSLVGTLVEIGRGDRPVAAMRRLLEPGHTRDDAGFTAEARGLCLEQVVYPLDLVVADDYP